MRNKGYEFNKYFTKKYIPWILSINFIFNCCIIFMFIYNYINNILGSILLMVSVSFNVYIHVTTYMYLEEKYQLNEK